MLAFNSSPRPPAPALLRHAPTRRRLLPLLCVAAMLALPAAPVLAASTFVTSIVQEPGEYEARFPDIIKLNDGRLMAVWHRAKAHQNAIGTIRLSFGSADGKRWSTPSYALANPGTMANIDTRDPKLGKMKDGSVVLTFFVPGGKVYYSVWKPGWRSFTNPVQLTAPGLGGMYTHGSALALDPAQGQVNQVLIPVYSVGTKGGAHAIKATWQPNTAPYLRVTGSRSIIVNNNPVGREYFEPSFVQFGSQVVTAIRAHQNKGASPVIIARWNPYPANAPITYQYFSGVLASSHHLLKTSDGRVLFTYGDNGRRSRPTVGMLIRTPASTWKAGRVVPIYNSGHGDQANPSSVEISPGVYLTLGYNAKTKQQSRSGGSLWVLRTTASAY